MAYSQNIPQPTDDPSDSQPLLLGNFQAINSFLGQNHLSIADGEDGKHKFMQMPEQASAPTTAANEGALYTKEGSASSTSDLFYRQESDGTEIQLTSGTPTSATDGTSSLPGGIIIKWGSSSWANGSNSQAVTFTTAFSSSLYSLVVTAKTSAGYQVAYQNSSVSGFTAYRGTTSGLVTFTYIAIGA